MITYIRWHTDIISVREKKSRPAPSPALQQALVQMADIRKRKSTRDTMSQQWCVCVLAVVDEWVREISSNHIAVQVEAKAVVCTTTHLSNKQTDSCYALLNTSPTTHVLIRNQTRRCHASQNASSSSHARES